MPISRRNLIIAASLGGLGSLTGAIGEEHDNYLYRTASSEASRRIGLSTMLITLSLAMLISFLTPDGVLITEVV
jgi:hypothetical protein